MIATIARSLRPIVSKWSLRLQDGGLHDCNASRDRNSSISAIAEHTIAAIVVLLSQRSFRSCGNHALEQSNSIPGSVPLNTAYSLVCAADTDGNLSSVLPTPVVCRFNPSLNASFSRRCFSCAAVSRMAAILSSLGGLFKGLSSPASGDGRPEGKICWQCNPSQISKFNILNYNQWCSVGTVKRNDVKVWGLVIRWDFLEGLWGLIFKGEVRKY